MTLTPAYGRDYKNKKSVLADWNEGKDFIVNDISSPWNGKPVNKSDLLPGKSVQLRYNQLRSVVVVNMKGN